MEKEYLYKFSVVIPIYNVEKYLEETILSVIKQTIGFEENIQMILVNDGSPDSSEEICLKYANKYPKNIVYIKQENAGVSAARNHGMKYAKGKYINFIDSDDTWEKDAFKKVYNFFEEHYDEIDMLACRMKFFDQVSGFSHSLDYKFKNDRIIDIKTEYNSIQLSVTSAFFKAETVLRYEFDTELKYSEDAKLISEILLEKEKYGVLSSATHNYRKREDNTSAIQMAIYKKEWYNDTVERCYKKVFDYSKQKFGKVIPYFQYQVMYDIQWRLREPIENQTVLTEKEAIRYIDSIKELLKQIEDYIICEQKKLAIELKVYALSLKYDRNIKQELQYRNKQLFFKNLKLSNLYNNYLMIIRMMDIEDNFLKIEGQITCILEPNDYEFYFESNKGKKYKIEYYDMPHKKRKGLERVTLTPRGFKVKIPLDNTNKLKVKFLYKNEGLMEVKLRFEAYSKLHEKYRRSYYVKDNYMITANQNSIKICQKTKGKHIKAEILYMFQLIKREKTMKPILYRGLYYLTKLFYHKPIWIVSDRPEVADDNGMHMFQYLLENAKDKKIYFVISKKSRDYKKMKKMGRTLKYETLRYKMKFLHASKIISSQANECTINAFGAEKNILKDLYKFDFVFLQHGIIKDNLSEWLHKQNKNIRLFITSAKAEYDSIVNGNYGYDKNIVKLTGLPRYDKLYTKEVPKKQIVFMPTWRKSLAGIEINDLGERAYNSKFIKSKYYQYYNRLINDERLLKTMKEKGYTGVFCVHPIFQKQSVDFKENECVKVIKEIKDYQREFKENRLLVTDFSSVAFDFAYLKKPIIYTQFDIDTFFKGHMYTKGYFDYPKNGFGPVCFDYETTVNTIIQYIENDCKLEAEYEKRINNFYYKFDTNNCKRIYEEILKLDRK